MVEKNADKAIKYNFKIPEKYLRELKERKDV